jgi:oligopeptide/dipeptide ABC transporter ATP-binding protein
MSDPAVPILDVRHLDVAYPGGEGPVRAVRDVSLAIRRGEAVGVMGESGSGKSTLLLAILRLLGSGVDTAGEVRFNDEDLVAATPQRLGQLRGDRLAMVFQDPQASFSPVFTLASQFLAVQHRSRDSRRAKLARAVEALRGVGIPDPERRIRCYPHQFSGGMLQRAAIALALMSSPDLLIADEPTTALDATMEAQIIALLHDLRRRFDGAVMIVSHQPNVIAELCDRVLVMYGGVVVEEGPTAQVLNDPRHPYTRRLIACEPSRIAVATRRLPTIPGAPPDLSSLDGGCAFAARCLERTEACALAEPQLGVIGPDRLARCHLVRPTTP